MKKQPAWLKEAGLQKLFADTRAAGGEARAVGGAVRDWLMGLSGADVDVASTLTPEQTITIAEKNQWKAIPTGIEHGTVTLVLPSRVVEVTTLRRDVTTDGRRATVAFTDDWKEDAARRDFTINALYLDAKGTLTDFFDGENDIKAQRIVFIGDAAQRISEDALRILRYFRFLASHGKPPADEAALAAIAAKKEMLPQLSGERIANEMRKLLSVENPAHALRLMKQTGVVPFVFGGEIEPQNMIRLHMLESQADYMITVWARIWTLLPNASAADATWISERWKISRHEAQQLKLMSTLPKFDANAPQHFHTRLIRLHSAPAYMDWLLSQAATTPGIDIAPYVTLAQEFKIPIFPVTAKDLMANGMNEGKELGEMLQMLERTWEESDYTLTREQLLQRH